MVTIKPTLAEVWAHLKHHGELREWMATSAFEHWQLNAASPQSTRGCVRTCSALANGMLAVVSIGAG